MEVPYSKVAKSPDELAQQMLPQELLQSQNSLIIINDGLKLKASPYFWCKCFPLDHDPPFESSNSNMSGRISPRAVRYAFMHDVVDIGETFLIKILEFFEQGARVFIRGVKLFPSRMLLDVFNDVSWILTNLLYVVQLTNVCGVFPSFKEYLYPYQIIVDDDEMSWHACHPSDSEFRSRSAGKPYLTLGLCIFSDEWGGSKRGKYNRFESIYGNLSFQPRKVRNLAQNCWHFCSSNVVNFPFFNSVMERIRNTLSVGLTVWAADLQELVFVDGDVFALTADNPRQQDLCSCAQSSAKYWCRKCYGLKGKVLEKGAARCYEHTRAIVEEIDVSTVDPSSGVKDNGVDDLRQHRHLDPHSDTAIEILHTILLGLVKYMAQLTVNMLNENQKKSFLAALRAENFSGFAQRLNGNPINNWKSFQGGDFKVLVQVMPYLLLSCGAPQSAIDGWLLASEISKYAYKITYDSRPDREPHPEHIRLAVKCLLDIFPSLREKFKLHLLACHLVTDFIIYGLLVNASSERFEALNKIMRQYLKSSNQQSPSRDIAFSNARASFSLFLLRGGQWLSNGLVLAASSNVQALAVHPGFSGLAILKEAETDKYIPRLTCMERDRNDNLVLRLNPPNKNQLTAAFRSHYPTSRILSIVESDEPIAFHAVRYQISHSVDCMFSKDVKEVTLCAMAIRFNMALFSMDCALLVVRLTPRSTAQSVFGFASIKCKFKNRAICQLPHFY
eukprot:Pompholyxophrys_punicea_v1_NODE_232_length_2639_cov_3.833204.p1 type:complete len:729 gc:universal NODE_232_length_2639_cov_3.833204:335-2521(+)